MNKAEFPVFKSQEFYLSKLQARIRYLPFASFPTEEKQEIKYWGIYCTSITSRNPSQCKQFKKQWNRRQRTFQGCYGHLSPLLIFVSVVEVQLYHSLDNSLETMIAVKAAPGAQEFL